MDKMNKRELLRKQVLELYARGLEVYQTQLDNAVDIDDITDEVILNQINSLKELRDKNPKLTRDINDDLNVLLSQINPVDIKNYNKINIPIRNDTENEYINILYYLSILENANLTVKQKDLLIDICSGYSYEGRHKSYNFLINKLEKSKGGVNKMNNKRVFTDSELRKLFPTYFKRNSDIPEYDNYLNAYERLPIYEKDVQQSKQRGDYFRQLSLQYAIYPISLECNEVKEND